MKAFNSTDDLEIKGKRVLLRVDFNLPVKNGVITDNSRILRAIPTIRALQKGGAKVVLMTHYGRPKGQRVESMSLGPIVAGLVEALEGDHVHFVPDCIGDVARAAIEKMAEGDLVLLENLRFYAGEEANDKAFAKALADLGDIYVNDAFSMAHRAHASTEALAKLLPSAAGRLMQTELERLHQALEQPERPVAALVGGAKISTKLKVISNLLGRVDKIIIGGGMANSFLAAQGKAIGKSLCEFDLLEAAREILLKAQDQDCEVILPLDVVVAPTLDKAVAMKSLPVDQVPEELMILDAGPQTVALIEQKIADCKTLVWNGPMGCFETAPFDRATNAVATFAAKRTKAGLLSSIAGGGDTVAALSHAGVVDDFSYLSTAGGAFLEWLEGKTLPGVKALEEARPCGSRLTRLQG